VKKRNKAEPLTTVQQIFQGAIFAAIPDKHLPGSEWADLPQEFNADQLRRIESAPGGPSFIAIANAFHAGMIVGEAADKFGDLINGLDSILLRASRGGRMKTSETLNADEEVAAQAADKLRAEKQLEVLDRIVFVEDYGNVGKKMIEKVSETILSVPINKSLSRGWDLLEIMRRLSFVVEPKEPEKPSEFVVRRELSDDDGRIQQCGRELYEILHNEEHEILRIPDKVEDKYIKLWAPTKRPKLKSLAISLYLMLNRDTVTRRTLTEDLKAVQKWQEQNLAGYQRLLPRGATIGRKPAEIKINYIPHRRTRKLRHKR
jgi:hypothetical protein